MITTILSQSQDVASIRIEDEIRDKDVFDVLLIDPPGPSNLHFVITQRDKDGKVLHTKSVRIRRLRK